MVLFKIMFLSQNILKEGYRYPDFSDKKTLVFPQNSKKEKQILYSFIIFIRYGALCSFKPKDMLLFYVC